MSDYQAECYRCGITIPFNLIEDREWWKCGKCGERNYTALHLKNSHSKLKNRITELEAELTTNKAKHLQELLDDEKATGAATKRMDESMEYERANEFAMKEALQAAVKAHLKNTKEG